MHASRGRRFDRRPVERGRGAHAHGIEPLRREQPGEVRPGCDAEPSRHRSGPYRIATDDRDQLDVRLRQIGGGMVEPDDPPTDDRDPERIPGGASARHPRQTALGTAARASTAMASTASSRRSISSAVL